MLGGVCMHRKWECFIKIVCCFILLSTALLTNIHIVAQDTNMLDEESMEKGKRIETLFERQMFTNDIKDALGNQIATNGMSDTEKKAMQVMFGFAPSTRGLGLSLVLPYGVSANHEKWRVNFDRLSNMDLDWSCFAYYTVANMHLHCMQPLSVAVNNASDYYEDDITRHIDNPAILKELGYINALGYGFRDDYSDEMDWATQICIWQRLHDWAPNVYPQIRNVHPEIQTKVNIVKDRVRMMMTSVAFKDRRLVFEGIGEQYAQYLRDTTNTLGNYTFDYATAGIRCERVMDESGGYNTLKVWLDQPLANGEIQYSQFYGDDQIRAPRMFNSPLSQAVGDYGKPEAEKFRVFVSIAQGNLIITKVDDKGNNVANTSFMLSYHADMRDPIGTYTTNADGNVHVTGLTPGIVYVQEIQVPEHLVLDKTIQKVTVTDNQTITFTQKNRWKKGKIRLRKQDQESHQSVAGAVYGIYDQAGKLLETLTTKKDAFVESNDLLHGTYTVKELQAPPNYVLNPKVFTVKIEMDEQVLEVTGEDASAKGKIRVYKEGEVLIDAKRNEEEALDFIYEKRKLANATFQIFAKETIYATDGKETVLYKKDALVDTITTTKDGVAQSIALPLGKYYVKEKQAPIGYVLQPTVKDVTLSYKDQNTAIVFADVHAFFNQRQKVKIQAHKTDASSKKPLSGAWIALYANKEIKNVDGKVVVKKGECIEKVMSDEHANTFFKADLPVDVSMKTSSSNQKRIEEQTFKQTDKTYYYGNANSMFYVKELKAPLGYTLVSDVIHYVNTAYQGQEEASMQFSYTYVNDKTNVKISKIDITNQAELPGAKLALYTSDEKLIEEWISQSTPHMIEGLLPGEYILREKKPADGFVSAEEIRFTVRDDVVEQIVKMQDDISKVAIQKLDEQGNVLVGTQLELLDKDANVIDTWVSEETPHRIDQLIVNETYRLHEKRPSNGYASGEDITFVVKDSADIQMITMENQPLDMEFEKVDEEGKPLRNAWLCVKDANGQIIDEWISDGNPHKIRGLTEKATYTYEELNAPQGYFKADIIHFQAKQKDVITMQDIRMRYQIQIVKVDENERDLRLEGAHFTLYEDEACTKELKTSMSDENGELIFEALLEGTYYIKETKAPKGYEASSKVYTIRLNAGTCIYENNMYILTVRNKKERQPLTGNKNATNILLLFFSGSCVSVYALRKKIRKTR